MRRLAESSVIIALMGLACTAQGCASLRGHSSAAAPTAIDVISPYSASSVQSSSPDQFSDGASQQPNASQLYFLDPYQPGKIPVVLIHGLFSSPEGWEDMVGYLRAAPGFNERFQLWAFGYPTTQGFLQSAAALRAKLRAATDAFDPQQADPALRRIVLVGHSMGGLIAKLQVTYADEIVWARVANRPLEEIVTTESTRAFLAETCYFDPSPNVCRVIFIAAPHCGSLYSSAVAGRCTSHFIQPTAAQAELHQQLLRDNPHTFNPALERRFPTMHTILGVSHPLSLDGPSDGVVSVSSAMHPDCESVLAINAPHAKLHHRFQTSVEILRILNCDAALPAGPIMVTESAGAARHAIQSSLYRSEGVTAAASAED
jgi:pimeloyl-ACP methyl ester carboxylesterase